MSPNENEIILSGTKESKNLLDINCYTEMKPHRSSSRRFNSINSNLSPFPFFSVKILKEIRLAKLATRVPKPPKFTPIIRSLYFSVKPDNSHPP